MSDLLRWGHDEEVNCNKYSFCYRIIPVTGWCEVWTTNDNIDGNYFKNLIDNNCSIDKGSNCWDTRLHEYKYVITPPWKNGMLGQHYRAEDIKTFLGDLG